jgi:hypothetical protein
MEIIRRIHSDTLNLKELRDFIGKRVKINIEVIDDETLSSVGPHQLGRYKLGKDIDDLNLRDFAYEEK